MGVVWKAVDTTLDREVAIKVLPELFSSDADRLARFQREAKLLASLNHPNIAAVFGLHETPSTGSGQAPSDDSGPGLRFLAMELVPGESLADRLKQGPLSVDQALFTGVQVAEALEAAHAQGVVHRDLKPGNIIICPDGKAKVLDFGLAKSYENEGSGSGPSGALSATMTTGGTREGVILGTAAYMSPEQARGRKLDKRTDIWAFGCVLYECLTALGPYKGETVSDSLGAILHKEPDYDLLPEDTPPMVRLLLRRCLTKNAKKRLHDIADARIELEQAIEDPQGSLAGLSRDALAVAEAKQVRRKGRIRKRFAAAGIALGLAAGFLGGWMLRGEPQPQPVRKLDLGVDLEQSAGTNQFVSISPDGSRVVFTNQNRLWVQLLNELEPRLLEGIDQAEAPFWSPDGEWIGYFSTRKLWKVQATGGRPVAICELGDATAGGVGGSWGEDGTIVYARGNSGLIQVTALGGQPREILPTSEGIGDYHEPSVLPGGRGILLVVHRQDRSPGQLAIFVDGETRLVLDAPTPERIWFPVYANSGHILFRRAGGQAIQGLWALPFSLDQLEPTGEPFLIAPDASAGNISQDGDLVFIHHPPGGGNDQMVWVDRSGRILEPASNQYAGLGAPSLSPDGRFLAFTAGSGQQVSDSWLRDMERGTETRLTRDSNFSFNYNWHPSGDLVYSRFEPGEEGGVPAGIFVCRMPVDGSAVAVKIGPGVLGGLSPDGQKAVVSRAKDGKPTISITSIPSDIWLVDLDGTDEQMLLSNTSSNLVGPISPDGRWLVYSSDSSGRREIYLTRFPEATGRWQVSLDGGEYPQWSHDGADLFFRNESQLLEVSVGSGSSPQLGQPVVLFETNLAMLDRGFSIGPNEERFILAQSVRGDDNEEPRRTGIKVVQNWYQEFE